MRPPRKKRAPPGSVGNSALFQTRDAGRAHYLNEPVGRDLAQRHPAPARVLRGRLAACSLLYKTRAPRFYAAFMEAVSHGSRA